MTKNYKFEEGRIDLPSGYADRSVNIFVQEPATEGPSSLQVARDIPRTDETLDDYVDRQVRLLKRRIKGLAVQSRETVQLAGCEAEAVEIETKYHSNGKTVYQRQCAVFLLNGKALIFTMTGAVPFTQDHMESWRRWTGSFARS